MQKTEIADFSLFTKFFFPFHGFMFILSLTSLQFFQSSFYSSYYPYIHIHIHPCKISDFHRSSVYPVRYLISILHQYILQDIWFPSLISISCKVSDFHPSLIYPKSYLISINHHYNLQDIWFPAFISIFCKISDFHPSSVYPVRYLISILNQYIL